MRPVKWLGITLGAYVGLVVAFEGFVGFMGHRDASRGVDSGADWMVITTTDADGTKQNTAVAVAGEELVFFSPTLGSIGSH